MCEKYFKKEEKNNGTYGRKEKKSILAEDIQISDIFTKSQIG